MKSKNKYLLPKIIVFLLISFTFLSSLSADTIIDTVYSSPELDGGIALYYNAGQFWLNTSSGHCGCGDGWDGMNNDFFWERGYFSFELPEIPTQYSLESANIYISVFIRR